MNIPAINFSDGYKADHRRQYPDKTTTVYSNFCPRGSRREDVNSVVFFGLQYFLKEYLINQYNAWFATPRDVAVQAYKRRMDSYLGVNAITVKHIAELHDLQYLPLLIKALPEGTVVPIQTPPLTIRETRPEFSWLTNYLETVLSCTVWPMCTSATTALQYRVILEQAARDSGELPTMVKWQAHDFSMRGMFGVEAACMSGAAHLLSFTGTDTIPALDFIEKYYGEISEDYLLGGTVFATEHSVMCAGGKASESDTILRLIKDVYPAGIVSVVSDTWDFWGVVTKTLPRLKDTIMGRDGKLVIRPDSGDPVKIICGDPEADTDAEKKGLVECLWDIFGGTVNASGYKLLDSHIGAIYGDSITVDRAKEIVRLLLAKKFASTNIVLGVGSYTYQYVTRDTFMWAMKATYAVVDGEERILSKAPKTDMSKASHYGLLRVNEDLTVTCGVSVEEEDDGLLKPVFRNSVLLEDVSFPELRERIDSYVNSVRV